MTLGPGTTLGRYLIESPLGAGGMGDVYLAEDTGLHRRVALKLLSSALAADDTARKRLVREAQAAAALDHPNICTIYEVGEADGHSFIAMQYVDGETLAERLKRGPVDLPTTIALARQVAEALAEAHRLGIVHRDIKPQNIMLTRSGQAKVLDFGIAKTAEARGTELNTASALTAPGLVPGTMSYMSPEQARGEPVDQRSDIFSFGIVLFEMVSRAHPFAHASSAETASAILTKDPAVSEIAAPAELRRILRKCLEKDRERRYQTMPDLVIDLENLARELTAPAAAASRPATSRLVAWATAIAAVLTVAAAALWFVRSSPPLSIGDYEQLTDFADSATAPSLSPDGRMVAFIRGGGAFLTRSGQIFVKQLPNGEAVQLTNDPQPKLAPIFTPDGRHVAFTIREGGAVEGWNTWTVPVSGGKPTRMLPNAAAVTWIDDRHILFSELLPDSTIHMGLKTSTQNRADARTVYVPAHERGMAHYSYLSPDRTSVLVAEMIATGSWGPCRLVPFDGSSAGRHVGPAGECRFAAWSPDGRWMYFSALVEGVSHLWRQRFPNGTPEPLTSGAATEEEGVAVAPDGASLVTSLGRHQSSVWLRDPRRERLISAEGFAFDPSLSPDGARAYYLLRRAGTAGTVELTMVDIATGRTDRLLLDFSVLDYDISRDEQQVVFTTAGDGGERQVWTAPLDRRSPPRLVARQADSPRFVDAGRIAFRSLEGHTNFIDRIGADGQARERVTSMPIVDFRGVAPDGKWLVAMVSRGGNLARTMAIPLDGGSPRMLCDDSCRTEWSPDGRRLFMWKGFFASERPLVIVPIPAGRTLPEFPAADSPTFEDWSRVPGVETVEHEYFIPSNDRATFLFTKSDEMRNLFRIRLTER
jgi:serine/threonine protein kinase/Tol biopolymer transport system component